MNFTATTQIFPLNRLKNTGAHTHTRAQEEQEENERLEEHVKNGMVVAEITSATERHVVNIRAFCIYENRNSELRLYIKMRLFYMARVNVYAICVFRVHFHHLRSDRGDSE